MLADTVCWWKKEKITTTTTVHAHVTFQRDQQAASEKETKCCSSSKQHSPPSPKIQSPRLVPASTAICLQTSAIGSKLTYSSNPKCKHSFHIDCILHLISLSTSTTKAKGDTHQCPCCRREFTNTDRLKEAGWSGEDGIQELVQLVRVLSNVYQEEGGSISIS